MLQVIALGLAALIVYLISDLVRKVIIGFGRSQPKQPRGDVIDVSNAWIDLKDMPYRKKGQVLTSSESQFYRFLQELLSSSGFVVLPKVRLAEIFDLKTNAPQHQEYLRRIRERCCDFLVCRKEGSIPELLIMAEKSRESEDIKQNREFAQLVAQAATIPLVTVNLDNLPDKDALRRLLTRAGLNL